MGHLREKHGMILLGKTPPGTCAMCAVVHDPAMPHDQQSLAYQYKFYDLHGRWPTWEDAMAHCGENVKISWREALDRYGIAVDKEPETAAIEIEISIMDGGEDVQ